MIALFVVLAAAGRYAFLPPGAPDGSQCFLDLSEGMPFELPPICEVPVTLVQHAPEPTVPAHATHDVTAICPHSLMQLQEWIWVLRPWLMPLSTITSIISPPLALWMMAVNRQWQSGLRLLPLLVPWLQSLAIVAV